MCDFTERTVKSENKVLKPGCMFVWVYRLKKNSTFWVKKKGKVEGKLEYSI